MKKKVDKITSTRRSASAISVVDFCGNASNLYTQIHTHVQKYQLCARVACRFEAHLDRQRDQAHFFFIIYKKTSPPPFTMTT